MNSLRAQILLLLVAAVFITAASILAAFWINTSLYTRSQLERSIGVATNSFTQLMVSREDQLINSAELLTSDFGFKQAVASQDMATIGSALFNHGDRVKADLMFLTDLNGRLEASTESALPVREPFPHQQLIQAAAKQGGALSFVRVGDDLYQIVVVTVNAPIPIAFTGVGFKLDLDVALELKALTGVEVTFVINGRDQVREVSTLRDRSQIAQAISAGDSLDNSFLMPYADIESYVSTSMKLGGAEEDLGFVYLSVPIAPYLEEFRALRNEILFISAIAIFIAFLLSTLFTRNVTGPLAQLARIAADIARGDYRRAEKPKATSEIDSLFDAFNQMGTDIKQREEHILYQATHDQLTGLLNRASLSERLAKWLQENLKSNSPCSPSDSPSVRALVCLNIKGFKGVNDSFGPGIGDKCLEAVAGRLADAQQDGDVVGRYGGDEFVIATSVGESSSIDSLLEGLLDRLEQVMKIDALALHLHFSVGYALSPEDGEGADDLLRRATIALDKARHEQVTQRRYVHGEDEEHIRSLKLIRDLRNAIEVDDGQLFMSYQPKMSLVDGTISKAEALIRWIHPEDGFISPELFIALAEQASLIVVQTNWVVEQVISNRLSWQEDYPGMQVAINVSAQDLESENLLPDTIKLLEAKGLTRNMLCFEMTERDMMRDAEKAIGLMLNFREAGFDLSVDDYGIGQSSLSKLKQMPVDEIKIDKLFITHLESSADDQLIARSTIKLGHDFGLRVIAEGVESLEATELLKEMGCDYIQGYHLARPMKSSELLVWLASYEVTDYTRSFSKVS